ncbi:hypothetical protein J2S21_003213 [Peribacillus cavernae]|nr:hypothetical protein [Peribacillus cavernae]
MLYPCLIVVGPQPFIGMIFICFTLPTVSQCYNCKKSQMPSSFLGTLYKQFGVDAKGSDSSARVRSFKKALPLFYDVQLQRLAPRGHKPITVRRKERLLSVLVLCLSGLNKALPLFFVSKKRCSNFYIS